MKIGYARVSTVEQDLTIQQHGLEALGVDPTYIFVDRGLTGTNRARPGLREAMAAVRAGDTLVVTKLDPSPHAQKSGKSFCPLFEGIQVGVV